MVCYGSDGDGSFWLVEKEIKALGGGDGGVQKDVGSGK